MHASKFNNAVDAFFPGDVRDFFLFLRIGDAQAKRLYISVEPGNWFEQIVDLQNRQGSPLNRLGNICTRAK